MKKEIKIIKRILALETLIKKRNNFFGEECIYALMSNAVFSMMYISGNKLSNCRYKIKDHETLVQETNIKQQDNTLNKSSRHCTPHSCNTLTLQYIDLHILNHKILLNHNIIKYINIINNNIIKNIKIINNNARNISKC